MTSSNDFDPQPQPELFSALLTPHRSLNRTGFLALMIFVSLVSFAAGLAFLLMGAWPVFGFFGLDVIASSFVLWLFVFSEGRRIGMRHLWLPVLASLVVGVSLGLPLFLYMRQLHLDATTA